MATLSSFVVDFAARQKIGGTHLTYGYLNQLPVPSPVAYDLPTPWMPDESVCSWLSRRILKLTITASDLVSLANDCGTIGPLLPWDDEFRFFLRCELDAALFHLYFGPKQDWNLHMKDWADALPTTRHAVEYVMETFPILKRKEEERFGEYRTKRVVLGLYDSMQEAIETRRPYEPGDDSLPPLGTAGELGESRRR